MTVRENTAAPHLGQQPPSPMIINCIRTRELFAYSIFVCGHSKSPQLPLFYFFKQFKNFVKNRFCADAVYGFSAHLRF